VEEHHKLVKRALWYLVRAQLGLHVAFAFLDTQPLACVACGFVAHVFYAALLPRFPAYKALSPEFLGAVVLCVASHALWGNHFYNHTYATLEWVGAFFVVVVWPAPFLLFMSYGSIDGLPVGGLTSRAGIDGRERPGSGFLAALGLGERLNIAKRHAAEEQHNGTGGGHVPPYHGHDRAY